MSALLDLLPLGVAHLDAELRIREANLTLAGLLGCPGEALVGRGLAALWPALAGEAACVLAGGAPAELRAPEQVPLPGSARALRVRLHPLPLPDSGEPGLGLVVEELAQSEAEEAGRLRALFSSVPVGVAYFDRDLRFRFVNPALAAIDGRSAEDHVGRTIVEVVPDLGPVVEPHLRRVLETGQAAPERLIEGTTPADRGTVRALGATDFPVRGPDGEVAGVGALIVDRSRQVQAEAALRQTKQALAQFIEHVPAAVAIFDRSLRCLAASRRYCADFHLDAGSVLGRTPYEIFPEVPESLRELHRRCLGGIAEPSGEFVLRRPDGALDRVRRTIFPWYEREGEVGGIVFMGEVVTAQVRAEEALRESEARHRTLFETMAQGVVYQDGSGAIIDANPAAERILGLSLSQMQGRSSMDPRWRAIREDGSDFPGEAHPAMVALRTGEEVRGAVMGVHHPGADTYRWLTIQAVPRFRPGESAPSSVYALFTDITEARQAAEALAHEHRQLTAILENLHEGVVAVRPDRTPALVNPAAQRLRLQARAPGGAGAAPSMNVFDDRGAPLPAEAWPSSRVLRGEVVSGVELRLTPRGHDEPRWFRFHGTPLFDEQGGVSLAVVTFDDITERKRAEELRVAHTAELSRANAELATALRLKDEFLAMMSHELRTPLNAVLGLTDALREEVYGPVTARQALTLAHVQQAGVHLLAIITDILDLAHLGAGAAKLDRRTLPVRHLVQAALRMVETSASAKSLRLSSQVEPGVERLVGDERRLLQILANLLQNAVKFTPAGGTVTLEVSADRARDLIRFAVRDDGIGIAPQDCARLFKPFTQVDGRLARAYGGIGLGLTLVRRLVDLHHGGIALESEPGAGSCFTVSLPWCRGNEGTPERPAELTLPTAAWATPPRVVLADDHELTLGANVEVLTRMGCEVAVARTGEEAVAQVHATRPEVVVMDVQMPGMNELAALRRLRAEPAWARVPILALSAQVLPGDRERCLAAGATRFLPKPINFRGLVEAIAEVLPPAR